MGTSDANITLAGIGAAAGYPNLDAASIPPNIRDGDAKARQAYAEGLAFESMLVNELSQQMANTMYGSGDALDGGSDLGSLAGSSGGAGGGQADGGGLSGAASAYSSLIPQTLTTAIMNGGGLGIAEQIAQELDPSLNAGQAVGS